MAEVDPIAYYDSERYLFETVGPRFRRDACIGAFDFFTIVIWKANRAKTKIVALLHENYPEKRHDLDAIVRALTRELAGKPTNRARLEFLLTLKKRGFLLPTASAILSVLYPDEFTVYDYRVCEELSDFKNLSNLSASDRLWNDYLRFLDAVRRARPDRSLRDCDRHLSGSSAMKQLEGGIRSWSDPRWGDEPTTGDPPHATDTIERDGH